MKEKQLNFQLDHGKEIFYANNIFVTNFDETNVLIDFRQNLHRVNPLIQNQTTENMVIKHQPVVMTHKHFKMLVELLNERLEKIEEEQGEIKLPKKWKLEDETKENKEKQAEKEPIPVESTTYIG